MFHSLDEASRASCRLGSWVVQLEAFEIPWHVSYLLADVGGSTYLEAGLPPLLDDILLTAWTRCESIREPTTASIMARCSKLSCVWKSASPVKNSTRMQPMLQMSQGYDHPRPRIISGAR